MTTNELIEHLRRLDPGGELKVLYRVYSDYSDLEADEIDIQEGVEKRTARYTMRSHPTMSPEEKAAARKFVVFPGN